MLTDSHCHLSMSSASMAALSRAREQGVRGFLVPATKGDDFDEVIGLARHHDDVWAAIGVHPHETKDYDDRVDSLLRELAVEPRIVAIGEIGLDYHYEYSPRDVQRRTLERQIEIARDADLPVILHNRESTEDLLAVLRGPLGRDLRGVVHSFTESDRVARELLDLGFYVSFSGILTFRSAEPLREVARRIVPDRVLIETDTPYLAPVPHRGKENEPAWVVEIAELLARLWDCPVAEVEDLTTRNFETLFGVEVRP